MSLPSQRFAWAACLSAFFPLLLFAQGTAFTYQGFLQHGESPAEGPHDFRFQLCTDAAGSALIGPTLQLDNLALDKGLFVAKLDFGNHFDGTPRWLKIAVRASGGVDFTALTPPQALTATPYAIRSANSALLEGQTLSFVRNASNLNAGTLADARIPAAITRDSEVMTLVRANDGSGSGLDADLLDGRDSTDFVGTTGPAIISGTDNANAILTVTQSGFSDGILATTASTTAGKAAVMGQAGTRGALINSVAGVFGTSASGRGVIGSSTSQNGVYGYSVDAAAILGQSVHSHGVRAWSQNNHAILAEGSVLADKLVYRTARTHFLSIPGDTFKPRRIVSGTVLYSGGASAGSYFATTSTGGAGDHLFAPVQVPHGARMTRMTFYYNDTSAAENLQARLLSHNTSGVYESIATIQSSGSAGNGSVSTAIDVAVHNGTTFYQVYVWPLNGNWSAVGPALRLIGMTIEYTLNEAP